MQLLDDVGCAPLVLQVTAVFAVVLQSFSVSSQSRPRQGEQRLWHAVAVLSAANSLSVEVGTQAVLGRCRVLSCASPNTQAAAAGACRQPSSWPDSCASRPPARLAPAAFFCTRHAPGRGSGAGCAARQPLGCRGGRRWCGRQPPAGRPERAAWPCDRRRWAPEGLEVFSTWPLPPVDIIASGEPGSCYGLATCASGHQDGLDW